MHRLSPIAFSFLAACAAGGASSVCTGCNDTGDADTYVDLPDGGTGIALDDLRYSSTLGRLVVAAGRTGNVDLVDPDSLDVTTLPGFTVFDTYNASDQQGVESADEGGGLVFAVDRAAFTLSVIDPAQAAIVATTDLEQTEPDYVRYSASTSEVWISNYGHSRLDVLTVSGSSAPVQSAFVGVVDGPEGITIDENRRQVYTRYFGGDVAVIDLDTRELKAEWPTGCSGAHGIPVLDDAGARLFVGCGSAEAVVLDLDDDGAILDDYVLGSGATISTGGNAGSPARPLRPSSGSVRAASKHRAASGACRVPPRPESANCPAPLALRARLLERPNGPPAALCRESDQDLHLR